ncbi:bile acid:sodium symporter family protein [Algoriphagus sp. A40]|uniref:bile acid:sodium symporter family protein n=1 Tax=Algoriphagus sp. A40 TaxID=1945863 RepID=UPI000985337A|nr:bile acid:sodium symporter family protein [Algoriphagus sp. A40]OOG71570.1 bile acid:sodium symporter [Algoriphagus sp. A40]
MKSKVYSYFLYSSFFVLLLAGAAWISSLSEWTGPLLILFFVLLGVGSRGYDSLKVLTYSLMILAAVTMAMFYPVFFQEYQGYKLTNLITPLIQVIMFGMGTSMSIRDFAGVVRTPQAVLIGVGAQFLIMPSLGLILAWVSGLPPEIAAGLILIGSSPSGLASNVMTYLAKANLALSITLTSVTTMLAPLMTPFLMKLLAGEFIEIDLVKMMWDIFKMIIIPIGAGLIFNKIFRGKSAWLDKSMPIVSMIGIGLIIVVITAAGRDALLDIGLLLIGLVMIHNFAGYGIGYWFARLFRMNEKDCRTVAIEVGMQNAGLASGIAKEMGKIATVGLAAAVFGPVMNISGSILASYWHKKEVK